MAVLHETTIINCYGDAVLRAVKVIYSVDTAGVKVCPSAQLAGCQTPGVVIELPVPSIPATYWRSQEKTVKVRVCPDPHLLDDNYSLQYQIRFESESRGGNGLHTELFESTMLIKGV